GGEFEPDGGEQWCARRLLARTHGYSRDRRRAEVRAVSRAEWQEFLLSWWHAAPGSQLEGRAGLAEVIEQMQGFECPAGEWEQLLAQRVSSYRPEWLDDLCLSGEVLWGRLSLLEAAADPGEPAAGEPTGLRSEEHTSELQSHLNLVCRLLLEKKNSPTKRSQVENNTQRRHQATAQL